MTELKSHCVLQILLLLFLRAESIFLRAARKGGGGRKKNYQKRYLVKTLPEN